MSFPSEMKRNRFAARSTRTAEDRGDAQRKRSSGRSLTHFLLKGQPVQQMPMIRLSGYGLVISFLRRNHRSPDGMRVMLLRRQHAGMPQPAADKLNICARV